MPPIKETGFIFTIIDVCIKVATMQPNPAISLKTENKLFKKMEISNSVSKRNPQET